MGSAVVHRDDGGVDQGSGDGHGCELVGLEMACCGHGQHEGQEVHEGIGGRVQDRVGVAGLAQPSE